MESLEKQHETKLIKPASSLCEHCLGQRLALRLPCKGLVLQRTLIASLTPSNVFPCLPWLVFVALLLLESDNQD